MAVGEGGVSDASYSPGDNDMKALYLRGLCWVLLCAMAGCNTQPPSPKNQLSENSETERSASKDEAAKVQLKTADEKPAARQMTVSVKTENRGIQNELVKEKHGMTTGSTIACLVAQLQSELEGARQAFNNMLFFIYMRVYYSSIQNAGHFDRAHFEAIVAEVRARGLIPGESADFRLDDISSPRSLRPLKSDEMQRRGENAGSVWAAVTVDGKLKVVIETKDLGHAGEFGFAFSEEPLSPKKPDDYHESPRLSLPSPLDLPLRKIDNRWWEVYWSELD